MSNDVKVVIDENAVDEFMTENFESIIASAGIRIECPQCGNEIEITSTESKCGNCGFIVEALHGEDESR